MNNPLQEVTSRRCLSLQTNKHCSLHVGDVVSPGNYGRKQQKAAEGGGFSSLTPIQTDEIEIRILDVTL